MFRPLHPEDFLDLQELTKVIRILPSEDYPQMQIDSEQSSVNLEFEPGTAVFCYPRIPPPDSPEAERLRLFAAARSHFLEFTDEIENSVLLNVERPMLEHFYTFFFLSNKSQELECKRLIRDHVKFKSETIEIADAIVSQLKPYNAVHIRRGDFFSQYPEQDISNWQLLCNVRERVSPGSTLYIATDEPNTSFFDPFLEHYEVYFLRDFEGIVSQASPDTLPCIEQLVCSWADVFVGTKLSTFSGYITRLRGYHSVPNTAIYFTDGSPGSEMDAAGSPLCSWTNWIRNGNPWWGREYEEGWQFC